MIQVVFVKWGNKYGPHYIKGLLAAIGRHTEEEIRPLCTTDDPERFQKMGTKFLGSKIDEIEKISLT